MGEHLHIGEKPHDWPECGKSFHQASTQKTHMKFHSGEKPHICEECEKTFTLSNELKVHIRYHSGERPYQCTVGRCEKN